MLTYHDFGTSNPIPVDATDLYLQVVYRGIMGTDNNAVAIGIRDISEPTPIDVFNSKDRICINGSWFDTGSSSTITAADNLGNKNGFPDECEVYPLMAKDIYIKISSPDDREEASPDDYDFHVTNLAPNTFKRVMYILTEPKFSYSFYNSWQKLSSKDLWAHFDSVNTYAGTAVKNQTEVVNDPQRCDGDPSCEYWYQPGYYSYRGIQMWWGGGLVYITAPYPDGSTCPN